MIQTGLFTKVVGYTTREGAIGKVSPKGVAIAEIVLGVGGGNEKYPVQWVVVTVWAELAEEALEVIDRSGMAIEASGMLQTRLYQGRKGVNIYRELKNVRELKILNRDGELWKVLSGETKNNNKEEVKV